MLRGVEYEKGFITSGLESWSRGYKPFFMLNSAELEIYPTHKC